jgi:hypothetical protein
MGDCSERIEPAARARDQAPRLPDEIEPVRRPSDIEEITNALFIHPISSRVALLLRDLHVSANAASILGMMFGLTAGVAYFHYRDWRSAAAGFALMIAWHIMDGADGQLARLTHSQSELGRVLDGICDYVTFAAVYTALALRLSAQFGNFVWPLAVAAGICHAIQAGAYEAQRQEYEYWGCGRASKNILKPATENPAPAKRQWRPFDWIYQKVQFAAIGATLAFHRVLERRRTDLGAEQLQRRYREIFAPSVRRWSLMSANYRTIGIFLCAIFKVPLAYFFIEIVGFSLVMALLTYQQRPLRTMMLRSLNHTDAAVHQTVRRNR